MPWAILWAQDDISKGFWASALTYSERYFFLLKFLESRQTRTTQTRKKVNRKKRLIKPREHTISHKKNPNTRQRPNTKKKPKYEATENKPSKFGRLKELAAKEGKTMNDAIALSEKMFGTNMINSLTETQFLEVVSALRTKKELPLGKPIQID